jgi:hypothetical protein
VKRKTKEKPGTVAHACNPSYSRGRDQEDRGSKPAWGKSLRPYHKKRAGGVAQDVGPEFKPQYHPKKKKTTTGQMTRLTTPWKDLRGQGAAAKLGGAWDRGCEGQDRAASGYLFIYLLAVRPYASDTRKNHSRLLPGFRW